MRIGLLDIDSHAKAKKWGATIYPYAQPYRDPDNPKRPIPQWHKDMAQWVNKHQLFQIIPFDEFEPRKGFKCYEYRKINNTKTTQK